MAEISIDVRTLPPQQRHSHIFNAFDGLPVADALLLTADHDPRPLYHQLNAARSESFLWAYVEEGPERWLIRVTKTAAPAQSDGNCCGHCGG